MTVHRRTPLAAALSAVLLGVGVAAAACSSTPATSAAQGTSGQGASSAAKGSPIVVGVAGALTGTNTTSEASAVAATRAWAKYVNAAGGIGGHPVTLDVEDTQSALAPGLAAAQDLVQNQHAVAVVVLDPIAETSIDPYLQQQHVPTLGVLLSSTADTGDTQDFYGTNTGISALSIGGEITAKVLDKTVIGNLYCQESPVCSAGAQAESTAAKGFSLNYVGQVAVSQSAPSYTAPCLQLSSMHVTAAIMTVQASVAARIAKDCAVQNYKPLYIVPAPSLSDLTQASGATFAGALDGFPWWVNNTPVVQYRAAMKQYEPTASYANSTATAAWAALQLFKAALAKAPATVTQQTVIQAYSNMAPTTLDGLLPEPSHFPAGQPHPSSKCFWMYQYQVGGNPEVVPPDGTSGNGNVGALSTTCLSS